MYTYWAIACIMEKIKYWLNYNLDRVPVMYLNEVLQNYRVTRYTFVHALADGFRNFIRSSQYYVITSYAP